MFMLRLGGWSLAASVAWAVAFVSSVADAANYWKLLGTSDGIEIHAHSPKGSWCQSMPTLTIVGKDASAFSDDRMANLAREIGEHLASECQEMRAFRLFGQTAAPQSGAKPDFTAVARGPDWSLTVQQSPTSAQTAGKTRSTGSKPWHISQWAARYDRQREAARKRAGMDDDPSTKLSPQEEFERMFSGTPIDPPAHADARQIVSGNTLYGRNLSGILVTAKYHRPDGNVYLMYLPKTNLITFKWTANGKTLCHHYENPPDRRCFEMKKDKDGKVMLYSGGQSVEELIRIVEGDPKNLEATYTANAEYYDAEARKNAEFAPIVRGTQKVLEMKDRMEAEEQAQLCRDHPAEYRRRFCQGLRTNCRC